MTLPSDLVSQFAKITNDKSKDKKESTSYGTIVERDGRKFVKMDGSDLLTPVTTTTTIYNGERVTVQIKNHQATVTGNITSPSARLNDITDVSEKIVVMDGLIANKVDTGDFNAEVARIDQLTADNVVIKETLVASEGDISKLETNNLLVNEKLTANEAAITKLQSEKIDTITANATYATITNLDATNANVRNLDAAYADINTLIFGSASGTTIHTSFSNAVIAQLGNAQIKSAMIDSVSANQIKAGDIITNNVRVKSEDGSLIISDETMQISDDTRVRVQIGKDVSNDYSINIWDAEGNLMFSKGGITDSAIKEAIIRNDMVSDTANIAAHKLDIDSLFEEINGGTNTIKSTKIYLDDEGQTLDVAFDSLSTEVSELGETITSQGTDISVIQGKISSKVWQQDINTAKNEMSTQYSTLSQTVNGISSTVAEHTTAFDNLEIGGRNLLLNSDFVKDTSKWTYNSVNPFEYVADEGYSGGGAIRATITTSGTVVPRQAMSKTFASGTSLTCSVKIKEEQGEWGVASQGRFANLYSIPYSYHKDLGDGWTLYVYTSTLTEDVVVNTANVFGFSNIGVGVFIIDQIKLEIGTKATDWTPAPEDISSDISSLGTRMSTVEQTAESLTVSVADSAKTATNFLKYSSSGLVVGDITASTLGKNVLIDSDSVDIRNGTTTLASFGANTVTLGRNAEDSVIDLCNGAGKISANTASAATSYPNRNAILIDSQEIETESVRFVASTSNGYGSSSTPSIKRGTELYMLRSTSSTTESCARLKAEHKTTSSGAYTNAGISAMTYDSADKTRAMLYASDSANSNNNQVNVYPTKTTMNKNLVLNGTTFTGKNKVLWTGGYYMSDTQTATLSEAISAQANGIVLVWSEYTNGASSNANFNMFFVPKHFITLHAGKGMPNFIGNGSANIVAMKYVYISDTTIKGYAGNDDAATEKNCGITVTPNRFVLRYVIGV